MCTCHESKADPVDTETGDFSETATDVSVATYGPPIEFTRTYDSTLAQAEASTEQSRPARIRLDR